MTPKLIEVQRPYPSIVTWIQQAIIRKDTRSHQLSFSKIVSTILNQFKSIKLAFYY